MYFLSTLRVLDSVVDDCRTLGMFQSYGDLYRDVMENRMDMFEDGYYNYAVISYIKEGYYPEIVEQQWFSYYRKDFGCVYTINRPKELKDYVLYIMG